MDQEQVRRIQELLACANKRMNQMCEFGVNGYTSEQAEWNQIALWLAMATELAGQMADQPKGEK